MIKKNLGKISVFCAGVLLALGVGAGINVGKENGQVRAETAKGLTYDLAISALGGGTSYGNSSKTDLPSATETSIITKADWALTCGTNGGVFGNNAKEKNLAIETLGAGSYTEASGVAAALSTAKGSTVTTSDTKYAAVYGRTKFTNKIVEISVLNTGFNGSIDKIYALSSTDGTSWTVEGSAKPVANSTTTISITGKENAFWSVAIDCCSAEFGGGLKGCKISLYSEVEAVDVSEITLNPVTLNLADDATSKITPTVLPNNATDKSVTWSSDNEEVATVDANGLVTTTKGGIANITCTSVSNPSVSATCVVTVTPGPTPDAKIDNTTIGLTNPVYEDKEDQTPYGYKNLKLVTDVAYPNINFITGVGSTSTLYNNVALDRPINMVYLRILKPAGSANATMSVCFGDSPKDVCEEIKLGKDTPHSLVERGKIYVEAQSRYSFFTIKFTNGTSYIAEIGLYYNETEVTTYSVSTNLKNISFITDPVPTQIKEHRTLTLEYDADAGYYVNPDNLSVTMGGTSVTPDILGSDKMQLKNVTDDVVFSGEASVLTVTGITAITSEKSTSFKVGDDFVKPSIKADTVEFPEGKYLKQSQVEYSGFDMNVPGQHTVTVKYIADPTITCTYKINVYDFDEIKLKDPSLLLTAEKDQAFDLSKVVLTSTYGPEGEKKDYDFASEDMILSTKSVGQRGLKKISVDYDYKGSVKTGSIDVNVAVISLSEPDVITMEKVEQADPSKTSYQDWKDLIGDSTGTVYTGNSYIPKDGISYLQLKSKDNCSGIVTKVSKGKVGKVSVTWPDGKSGKLDIYGSNKAYSTPADLYGESKGTLLGTINYPSTELVVTQVFDYVGVRSHDGTSYLDSISFSYKAELKEFKSLKVTPNEGTTTLFKGDAFSFSGVATVTYKDDSTENIPSSLLSFSGYDMNVLGQQTVTATYADGLCEVSDNFNINVIDGDEIVSVAADTSLAKLQYYQGESFSSEGLVINGTNKRGNTVDVTNDCIIDSSAFNSEVVGAYAIKVTYPGLEPISYNVQVSKLSNLESITLSIERDEIWSNEAFKFNGKVTAHFDRSDDEDVTEYVTFSGNEMTVGTHQVTVSYTRRNESGEDITKTAQYTCVVRDGNALTGIRINTDLVKTVYNERDTFTSEGLVVYGKYANAPENVIAEGISVDTSEVNMAKAGTYTVKVRVSGFEATYQITVNHVVIDVTGVTLDAASKSIKVGENFTLVATVNPADADNKAVTWASSDATVASVDTNGKVTALKEGTTTITVTTVDGAKTATCAVTVTKNVTGISVESPKTEYTQGEEFVKPKVYLNFTDGSKEEVTNAVFSGYNKDQVGEQTITVTFEGMTTSYKVNVKAKGGCGGSVIATSAIVTTISLLGVGALLLKKKKED